MKLISLYIEQFGGLGQYALDFEAGLTVIREENGFGKTTLAEFIRAMFYGFPRKTKALGKRQKYLPWAGGKCGGNLEFEHQGVRYRIERTFGATPKSDTFKLLEADTNRPSSRFTENIGIELFGLDGDSFERSTYLPQNRDDGPLSTDSIRAKLSDLVEDAGDVGNFEKAAAALKAKRSGYANYRGVGGSAAEALGKVSALQMELDRAEQARRELARVREEITRLEAERKEAGEELARVREQITQASQGAAVAAVQKQHRQLEVQLEAAQQERQALAARFPRGVPSRGALEAQRSSCTGYLTLTARAAGLGLSREEQAEYARLRGPYESGALDEAYLEALSEKHRQLDRLRERYQELPATAAAGKSWQPILALGLGVALLVLGTLLLVRQLPLAGGVAAGLGALALILGAVLGVRDVAARERADRIRRSKADLEAESETLVCQLEDQLGVRENFRRAIRERHMQRERYLDLEAEASRTARESAALQERADALRREVDGFLAGYFAAGIQPEQYHHCLDTLAREAEAWQRAGAQLARAEQALAEYRDLHSRELACMVGEPVDPEPLKAREWALNRRLDEISAALLARRQRGGSLEELAEKIPELEDQILLWQEKKQADMAKARLLDDTLDFLQQAKDSLATSYLGPIRRGLDHYLKKLTQTEEGRILIDPDLQLQPERQGQGRELGYFSAGQRDLLMLCMRLALVDALFAQEKPFVILDDPFVNLDDKRTAAALELLQELSRERQILYLVCNSSRAV